MAVEHESCEVQVICPAVRPWVGVGLVIEEPCLSSVSLYGVGS